MAKVIQVNSKNFIGTYPEKTEGMTPIPLVLFIGGILEKAYAHKEHLCNTTSDSIKQKAIFVFGNIGSNIKEMYSYGIELSKKSGIEISDNKLLLYSGGSEKAVPNLGAIKLSLIGMIDPTPLSKDRFKYISGYESRIRMVYKPEEWPKQLADRQPAYVNLINSKGGKASLVKFAHRLMPENFFRIYGQEVINPVITQPEQTTDTTTQTTQTQQPTATEQTATQAQPVSQPTFSTGQQGTLNPRIDSAVVSRMMKEYEKLSLSDDEDITTPTLDNSTSIDGFIKYFIEKHHRENFLKEDEELTGTVFRVPRLYTDTGYSHQQIISTLQTSPREFYYKVRVHKLDSNYEEMPDTFDGTPEDIAKINKYRDFLAPSNLKLKVGDTVSVTLGDMLRYKHGMIIRRIPESSADLIFPPVAEPASSANIGNYGIPVSNGSYTPGVKSAILPFNINENKNYQKLRFNYNISFIDENFRVYLQRSASYKNYVTRIARIYGIPPNLILAFISVESGFDPKVVSPAGAIGLTQFMPGTLRDQSMRPDFKKVYASEGETGPVDGFNPKHSIILCCNFVKFLLNYFKGNVEKASAGYNAGWGQKYLKPVTDWKGEITTEENANYVTRVPYAFLKFNEAYPDGKE